LVRRREKEESLQRLSVNPAKNAYTPTISPEASTSISAARDTFGRPGISIMFPEMSTTKSGSRGKRSVRHIQSPACRRPKHRIIGKRVLRFGDADRKIPEAPFRKFPQFALGLSTKAKSRCPVYLLRNLFDLSFQGILMRINQFGRSRWVFFDRTGWRLLRYLGSRISIREEVQRRTEFSFHLNGYRNRSMRDCSPGIRKPPRSDGTYAGRNRFSAELR